jgi:cysteine desulfurase/selenocysteine lyase
VTLECDTEGSLDLNKLADLIDNRTKLLAVIHASNVLGTIVPVERIAEIAKRKGTMVLIDGAQAAPHLKVDVEAIGCDFYAGSGHKMCGPSGTGFLYISNRVSDRVKPLMLGGGSATDVDFDKITYTEGPGIFEAGTPNIAGGIGLGSAVDYVEEIGMDKIRKHELELTGYLIEKLKGFTNLTIYGPKDPEKRTGVVSFNVENIPAHRVAILVDEIGGIAIRSGNHCAFLLTHKILKQPFGTARVSFYFYNTLEEVDTFTEILKDVT